MKLLPLVLTLLSPILAFTEDTPRGLLPADFYHEKIVTSTALAPDASLVAFVVM